MDPSKFSISRIDINGKTPNHNIIEGLRMSALDITNTTRKKNTNVDNMSKYRYKTVVSQPDTPNIDNHILLKEQISQAEDMISKLTEIYYIYISEISRLDVSKFSNDTRTKLARIEKDMDI